MQSTQKTSHSSCHKGKKPIEGGILINLELSGWQMSCSSCPKCRPRLRLRPEDRLVILQFSPHVSCSTFFLSREVSVMCRLQPLAATVTVTVSSVSVKTPVRSCGVRQRQQLQAVLSISSTRAPLSSPSAPGHWRPCPSSSFSAIPPSRRSPIFAR